MIPLYHDLSEETVLVVGGGAVGRRKALGFAEEARVVVVSPAFDDRLIEVAAEIGSSIELIRAAPQAESIPEWIDRVAPTLVVASTDDPAVNAAAEAAALDSGVLVNRTDVSGGRDPGSVVVPATVADGPVRVAISTGGRSPALSRALRERIGSEIEGAGAMAELSGELREALSKAGVDPETRREAIRRVVRSEGVWKGLQKGRSKARIEANNVIEEVVDR
ncbi:bifunctional precorrin-2 dehydrogenase/sirohydrochlorin ferrochelatase [Halorubrum rubrum]|uniref:precorrin-2 dehydrogenase n=1 Tax=Halorubrum rubrum TaxID=1126240 RepID=A0ABD5R278_9EURY|nr:NAD(P)-dependent oxidoreductase [Halorubrum rubrum]